MAPLVISQARLMGQKPAKASWNWPGQAGPIHWPKAAYGRGFRFGKPFPWLTALAWPRQAASHCKPSLTTMSTILKFCPSDLDSPCQAGLQKTVFSLVDL
jgi:hypothetical protein